MTIKEVVRYETQDGTLHKTLKSAQNWEAILASMPKYREAVADAEYSFRSQGEDNHIDRYFGRGC